MIENADDLSADLTFGANENPPNGSSSFAAVAKATRSRFLHFWRPLALLFDYVHSLAGNNVT